MTAVAVALAYQVGRPVTLTPGHGVAWRAVVQDVVAHEASFSWSARDSRIVAGDLTGAEPVRVEVDLAGWRPRGQAPPLVVASADGESARLRPASRGETVRLDVVPQGAWTVAAEIALRSETFRPGPGDPRELGVRIHAVRVAPLVRGLRLRRPPLGAVAGTAAAVGLLLVSLRRLGVPPGALPVLGLAAAAASGLLFALARPWAAALHPAALAASAAAAFLAPLLRRGLPHAAAVARESTSLLRSSAAALGRPAAATLVGLAAVALPTAVAWNPAVEVDLGSGREIDLASGFGPYDSDGGVSFRRASPGARLDLRHLGGGARWRVDVTASLPPGAPREVELVRAAGSTTRAALGPDWSTHALTVTAPWGWSRGVVLEFPATRGAEPRLDRVRVERGRSRPPLALTAALAASGLLVAVGLLASGLGLAPSAAAAAIVVAGQAVAYARDPLVAGRFLPTFAGITALGTVLAVVGSAVARLRGSALPAPAIAAAAYAVVPYLATTAYPLYRGGHFVLHSAVAEEIWQGRFLLYYLPYPGSMLSRQAQWGNLIVPHSCLFHTLVSPLAALPSEAFHLAEKAVVALMLAALVLFTAVAAQAVGGPRAAALAALAVVVLPGSYQLLGLGHLLAIFGNVTGAAALVFLLRRLPDLHTRAVWAAAVLLVILAFLSYTAVLLFMLTLLSAMIVVLGLRDRPRAAALLTASVAAGVVAFLLYYVHWAWPFLTESVPAVLSGRSAGPQASPELPLHRLDGLPHKLGYTFGSILVPLAGLLGLARVRGFTERLVTWSWAGILVVFSGADLFFNFLLKHHYFVQPPVAVGIALLLAPLADRGRAGRVASAVALVALGALGLRMALAAALGEIP